ncbi:hypothetical protein [Asticcacaulis solisilvae]|uniref:hypothetical protein n=1 Tax=Asticcacaulis solisilvae TaxID=1217274 RepID=UPI003FD782BF
MKALVSIILIPVLAGALSGCMTSHGDVVIIDDGRPEWGQASLVAGRPYENARATLVKSGLQPLAQEHARPSIICDDGFCKQYPEVVECSEEHLGTCTFAYRDTRTGAYVVVETVGDREPVVNGVWIVDDNYIARIHRT